MPPWAMPVLHDDRDPLVISATRAPAPAAAWAAARPAPGGEDVHDRDVALVLVHARRGHVPRRDPAEQAVVHARYWSRSRPGPARARPRLAERVSSRRARRHHLDRLERRRAAPASVP